MVYLNNKGVSPVIATVLLVMLACVLALLVFLWARSFIFEQIEVNGKPVEQVCSEISFEVDGEYDPTQHVVNLEVVNFGNVEIYGVDIKFVKGGDSVMKSFDFGVPISSSSGVQSISIEEGVTNFILYPSVLGSVRGKKTTKPVICTYSGKTVRLGSLRNI